MSTHVAQLCFRDLEHARSVVNLHVVEFIMADLKATICSETSAVHRLQHARLTVRYGGDNPQAKQNHLDYKLAGRGVKIVLGYCQVPW
jgi:hypothetical protein